MSDNIDKELSKRVLGKIFNQPGERRSSRSPLRGPERRSPVPRREPGRLGGRRSTDPKADPRLTERDLRVSATDSSSAATASQRGAISSAPARQARPDLLPKREWVKATEALPRSTGRIARSTGTAGTIGSSSSLLRKAGRLGKMAAAGLAAYGIYKKVKDQ